MRVEEVTGIMTLLLRQAASIVKAPPSSKDSTILALKSLRELQASVGQANALQEDRVSHSLSPGWEEEIAAHKAVNASRAPMMREAVHARMLIQEAVRAARRWDSEYVQGSSEDPHPENRFLEGVDADGKAIYAPVDHVARAFVPSAQDEHLAILLVQHAQAAFPHSILGEEKGDDRARNELLEWLIRLAAAVVVGGCLVLALS